MLLYYSIKKSLKERNYRKKKNQAIIIWWTYWKLSSFDYVKKKKTLQWKKKMYSVEINGAHIETYWTLYKTKHFFLIFQFYVYIHNPLYFLHIGNLE